MLTGRILSRPDPPRLVRMFEPDLGNDSAHPRTEMFESYFLFAERSHGEALRRHALLNARDQFGVLGIDLAVDAPIEVARSLHFAALIGQHIADFAAQAARRTGRQPLHEVDLVGRS